MRRLCMIFEAIGPYNAIGKIAMAGVQVALQAGFRVTVVASLLDESLRGRVEWLKLYVPPRGFALQWLTGRHFIRKALGGRTFDIVHGHQPQIPDLCDVFQCHFLTRVAYERNCLFDGSGLRRILDQSQKTLVMHAEDRYYRRWNPSTYMLFGSILTRTEFVRLYGAPPLQGVLVCPAPRVAAVTSEERAAARRELIGEQWNGIVVGFLGGRHERKGYRRLLKALSGERDIFLLMGGALCDGYQARELDGHFKSVGLTDSHRFYAACDVLLVPSHFEPFGLVASEAAARGIPVIATPEVGALPHLLEFQAGAQWSPDQPLGPLVREVVNRTEAYKAGGLAMADAFSVERYGEKLSDVYEHVLEAKNGTASVLEPAVASIPHLA